MFYFATLLGLRWWMAEREAYAPRRFMQLYNLSCVFLAGTSGVAIAAYKWQKPGLFVCNAPDVSTEEGRLLSWGIMVFYCAPALPSPPNPTSLVRVRDLLRSLSAGWLGADQKYWEFLDTFIFLLRKSYRQVPPRPRPLPAAAPTPRPDPATKLSARSAEASPQLRV